MSFEPPCLPFPAQTKQIQNETQNNREPNRTKRNKTNDVERCCGGRESKCECVWDAGEAIKSNPF